jgi:hypothetical protein
MSEALLLDPAPGLAEVIVLSHGQIEQANQVRPQGAAVGRACGDHLLAGQTLVRIKPTKHRQLLSNKVRVQRQGHELIVVGRRQMIRYLARLTQADLARLQVPATPDGVFVRGEDGRADKAAGGRPTLGVNHAIDGNPEDLNPSQLEELELTPERPAAELPETKVPPGKCSGQLVEVTGAQGLQEHEPCPVNAFNRREVCSFPT